MRISTGCTELEKLPGEDSDDAEAEARTLRVKQQGSSGGCDDRAEEARFFYGILAEMHPFFRETSRHSAKIPQKTGVFLLKFSKKRVYFC